MTIKTNTVHKPGTNCVLCSSVLLTSLFVDVFLSARTSQCLKTFSIGHKQSQCVE